MQNRRTPLPALDQQGAQIVVASARASRTPEQARRVLRRYLDRVQREIERSDALDARAAQEACLPALGETALALGATWMTHDLLPDSLFAMSTAFQETVLDSDRQKTELSYALFTRLVGAMDLAVYTAEAQRHEERMPTKAPDLGQARHELRDFVRQYALYSANAAVLRNSVTAAPGELLWRQPGVVPPMESPLINLG